MAYNYRFKKYPDGSCQLVYYNTPIVCNSYNDLYYLTHDIKKESRKRLHTNPFDDGHLDYLEFYGPDDLIPPDLTPEEISFRHERSVKNSLSRTIKEIYDLGRSNTWEWFVTFTLDGAGIDRTDYSLCKKKVLKWINNISVRKCVNLKYLIVPELHSDNKSWHFHALMSNCSELQFDPALNNQEFRKDNEGNLLFNKKGNLIKNRYYKKPMRVSYPDGDYIYNIRDYGNGWTTATKIMDSKKTISYILKYISKELIEHPDLKGKQKYNASRNLDRPEVSLVMLDRQSISEVIETIMRDHDVQLKLDYQQTKFVNNGAYKNVITYMEFQ